MRFKNVYPVIFLMLILLCSCNSKKKVNSPVYKLTQPLVKMVAYDEEYPLTDKEVDLKAPYKVVDDSGINYADFYKDKKAPPPFNFNQDITHKTFMELRLLRAEILARHGFLFMDYVLRFHFNLTNWYKPVFWYKDFKIKLSDIEKKFIAQVYQREQELYKTNYIVADGIESVNPQNVVNWEQFEPIKPVMMSHLKSDGFVINKGDYEQLFPVYDENEYGYIPNFVTTDLYLQVLHMHISKEMQAIEKEKMFPLLNELLSNQYNATKTTAKTSSNVSVKKAAAWNQVYYATALTLLTGKKQDVPVEYEDFFHFECEHAQNAEGKKSNFLGDSLMDYTQFKPRGNYTTNDSLKGYFRCMKWLNSALIFVDEDAGLSRAIVQCNTLLHSEASMKKYQSFSNIIQFLAGDENNLSFLHLIKILKEYKNIPLEKLLTKDYLNKIRSALYAADPKIMRPKGINWQTEAFLARKKILFTAGRYTFDGEILQRLIHVMHPKPKRTFPKGLDVFAAMGNKTAEDILLNKYKEKQSWESYPDTLNVLKNKFQGFSKWNSNVYNKQMEAVLTLQKPNTGAPYYMKSKNWQLKNLNTMLSSWTELKHDMVLYTEQPSGAEMGGPGDDVPPPQRLAYVEPNVEFWKKCIELLDLNNKMLVDNGLLTAKISEKSNELKNIADLFIKVSLKELSGQKVTNAEFDSLAYIGGRIEKLTLNIIDSKEDYFATVTTPEKYVAVVTDVYTYMKKCLEEGVGMGDEIYVIAEINGLLYLTRGAVFSHYEFQQPASDRLTDEEWQQQLLDHKEPANEIWMNAIKIKIHSLKTSTGFNL